MSSSRIEQPKDEIPSIFLGKTGLKVSNICLGAMTFSLTGKGGWGLPAASGEESFKILDHYVQIGGNFIDTADSYNDSEECIGKWIQSKPNPTEFRKKLIIATKVRSPVGPGPNEVGLSRKHILDGIERSLTRLNTNYIDLYQVHYFDPGTPLTETLSTLNHLVQAGKVRYIGVSNFTAAQITEAYYICKENRWEPFVCLQPQYNLLCRSTEWELISTANKFGMGIIPWSPLAGGWLSGKFKRGVSEPPAGSRVAWAEAIGWSSTSFSAKNEEKTWKILDELETIAKEVNGTVAQVALRWLMQKNTIPIIGAKTLEQLKDNLKAAFIVLSADQMKRLDVVSDNGSPYPWNLMATLYQTGRV